MSLLESSYLCTSMILRKGAADTPTYVLLYEKLEIQVFAKGIFENILLSAWESNPAFARTKPT